MRYLHKDRRGSAYDKCARGFFFFSPVPTPRCRPNDRRNRMETEIIFMRRKHAENRVNIPKRPRGLRADGRRSSRWRIENGRDIFVPIFLNTYVKKKNNNNNKFPVSSTGATR